MTRPFTRIAMAIFVLAIVLALAHAARAQKDILPYLKIKLTEPMVTNFIALQKDLAELGERLKAVGDRPDPTLQDQLDAIARKNGFAKYSEAEDVRAVIMWVTAGFDPETGVYTEPHEAIDKEIDELRRDPTVPQAERESWLKELREARKTVPPMPFKKENVDVVRKFLKDIEKAMQ
jgi:hypothetical protein